MDVAKTILVGAFYLIAGYLLFTNASGASQVLSGFGDLWINSVKALQGR